CARVRGAAAPDPVLLRRIADCAAQSLRIEPVLAEELLDGSALGSEELGRQSGPAQCLGEDGGGEGITLLGEDVALRLCLPKLRAVPGGLAAELRDCRSVALRAVLAVSRLFGGLVGLGSIDGEIVALRAVLVLLVSHGVPFVGEGHRRPPR